MKKLLFIICLIPLIGFSQNSDSLWFVTNYTKKEILIPMRDGVKLFTSIYSPKDQSEKHPLLITRTPYSCAPYGENNFSGLWRSPRKYFAKENYIIIQQDVRGRWMSEGNFVDVRPYNPKKSSSKDVDESSDTFDTIEWLIKNLENNNGNVGVYGTSYPGFYAAMAALSNHPALKAVSPQAPVTDWFIGDDFHHNGALMVMDAFGFYSSFGKPRPKPTTIGPEGFNFPIQDNYEFFLRNGTLPQLSKLMGDSIAFWNDLMNHPTYSDWWKNRNDRNYVQNISSKIPTLIVGGLFDAEDCWGAWNLYKAIESKAKNKNQLVIGPWYHGQWGTKDGTHLGNISFGTNTSDWYQQNIELPFFNFYLKGKGSIENISEATIFFSGENEWRKFSEWPSSKVQARDLFLTANGGLSYFTNKMAPLSSFTEYISDPAKPVPYTEDVHMGRTREYMTDDQRFAARRPDVLVYETPILTEDLTVAGTATADLMVSISGTDADFVVKIIDVFPDDFKYSDHDNYTMNGYQMLVRGEVMRGKFRNSYEIPEAFTPGKPTQVKFALPDLAHTFKKGHRLMIQIQSTWFPLVDRNPQKFVDIYHATPGDFQKESIKIFNNQSKIILPILK